MFYNIPKNTAGLKQLYNTVYKKNKEAKTKNDTCKNFNGSPETKTHYHSIIFSYNYGDII